MYRFLLTPGWLGRLAAALVLATVMSLLGGWQLSRYEERSAINDRIDAGDTTAPAPLTEALTGPGPTGELGPAAPAGAAWTMVTATGRYDADHEILVRGRTVAGQVGFEVVTPLVLPDGSAVLVDRGWVPPAGAGADAGADIPPAPDGTVTVVGRIRPGESRPRPVERHDGVLQTRRIHPATLASHLPYPLYDAYLQLATQDPPADPALTPIPVRRENAWLNGGYAVQWWLFAAMVLAGFGWLAVRHARRLPARAGSGEPRRAPAGSGG